MGYLAALLSKTSEDVSSPLLKMLEAASPCIGDAHGIASDGGVMITGSPASFKGAGSYVMLGYKLNKIMPRDPPQPLSQHGYSMIFEGRILYESWPSDVLTATNILGTEPDRGIRRLIEQGNGSYAAVVVDEGMIICGRDPVGVVPIYLGESEELAGAASNRKMLWTVGLEARPLPPGHIAEITKLGSYLEPVRTLSQPGLRAVSMDEAVEQLDSLLYSASEARSRGVFRAALGFSGGIDSCLLAYYLNRVGVEVELICVGVEGSREFSTADKAADAIGLPIRLESFTIDDVEHDLDEVLWSVEEPDPMKTGVAMPLHWAARSAAESGIKVLFSGCGSDELFGGYRKYVQQYFESGGAVGESMFKDVAASHEVNYERDYKICGDLGMELRLPFADINVIEFGLSLPLELKLPEDLELPRKRVLRALAKKIGLPDDVAYGRKRAVQYSTGVNKALKKLARGSGKPLSSYLTERFMNLKRMRLTEA